MDKDKIIVVDTNSEARVLSRFEFYAKLMQQVKEKQKQEAQ